MASIKTKATVVDTTKNTQLKNNQSKGFQILIGVTVALLVLLIVGTIAYFGLDQAQDNIDISSAENPLEALDKYTRKSALDIIDAINVDDFDPTDPLTTFDVESITEDLQNNSNSSKYFSISEETQTGVTVHQAIDAHFTSTDSSVNTSFSLLADIYSEVVDSHQISAVTNFEDLSGILESFDVESIKNENSQVTGNFRLEIEGDKIEFDFDIVLFDGIVYANIDDLEYDEAILAQLGLTDSNIEAIESGQVQADFVQILEVMVDYAAAQSGEGTQDTTVSSDMIYDQLNESLAESFGTLDATEQEQLEIMLKVLKKEMSTYLEETEFLTNITEVNAIRTNDVSDCYEGELNTAVMLDNGIELVANVMSTLAKEPAFSDQKAQIEDSLKTLEVQSASASDLVKLFGLEVLVRACNEIDSDSLSGAGMTFETAFTGFQSGGVSFAFDYLNVDFDSNFEIKAPEGNYVDITNQLVTYLESGYSSSSTYSFEDLI